MHIQIQVQVIKENKTQICKNVSPKNKLLYSLSINLDSFPFEGDVYVNSFVEKDKLDGVHKCHARKGYTIDVVSS